MTFPHFEKPIGELRRRMLQDMTNRNFGEKTKHDYIRQVAALPGTDMRRSMIYSSALIGDASPARSRVYARPSPVCGLIKATIASVPCSMDLRARHR